MRNSPAMSRRALFCVSLLFSWSLSVAASAPADGAVSTDVPKTSVPNLSIQTPAIPSVDVQPPAAAVASAHPAATAAGIEILAAGGNAFDAAVAISATLAVVEPYGSGLGGGGFWLLHLAETGQNLMVDGRERAPLAATRDMYLDADGRFVPEWALDGPLAAGIPGMPAALVHLSDRYGVLPLARTLSPAIHLAREGFTVDEAYRRFAGWRLGALRASEAAAAQFLVQGEVPELGHRLQQPDLAQTLERLAEQGETGFYQGDFAERLVDGVRAAGGIWSLEDLSSYRVVERDPVQVDFRGWRMISAAPPSSGGVALAQMLNILTAIESESAEIDSAPDSDEPNSQGPNSAASDLAVSDLAVSDSEAGPERASLPGPPRAQQLHYQAEAMRRAYRDRALYLGDSDVVEVPVERLISPAYGVELARTIDPLRASPSSDWMDPSGAGTETTHFSVLDLDGNRVAATLSINYPFGSGFVAPGTGVLLNDEMDDFAAAPGVPNGYGLVGGEANAIAPGKRMLSSMSPSFLESERGLVILGTPGGSRIITMVLHGILAAVDGRGSAQDWVAAPRWHHQFLPDEILFEPGAISEAERQSLEARGHQLVQAERPFGNMQLIHWDRQATRVEAASDPRGIGAAKVLNREEIQREQTKALEQAHQPSVERNDE